MLSGATPSSVTLRPAGTVSYRSLVWRASRISAHESWSACNTSLIRGPAGCATDAGATTAVCGTATGVLAATGPGGVTGAGGLLPVAAPPTGAGSAGGSTGSPDSLMASAPGTASAAATAGSLSRTASNGLGGRASRPRHQANANPSPTAA